MSGSSFQAAVTWVIAWEGGYTDDPGDPGNWTGGAIWSGELLGTNMGISAAAFPGVDIKSLTVAQAQDIYQSNYWIPIAGDSLPPALAMIVFDAAVNSGVSQSSVWLQVVVGAATDGVIGPETLAAVERWPNGVSALCAEVLAQRIAANGMDPNFSVFGLGWSRRTAVLAFQSATMISMEG